MRLQSRDMTHMRGCVQRPDYGRSRSKSPLIETDKPVPLSEADEPQLLEQNLNAAVDAALEHALKEGRHGILVTRHGHAPYTAAVSAEVPYGQTMERSAPAA
ncbi:hypothetical protein ABIB51_004010 [Arthrobacter sp. UYCu712]